MEIINCYKSMDGKIFTNMDDCINHEKNLNYPFVNEVRTNTKGDLGVEKVEVIRNISPTEQEIIDTYYILGKYKIRLNRNLEFFYKLPIFNNIFNDDYISFIMNVLYVEKNIDVDTFKKYVYYYNRHTKFKGDKLVGCENFEDASMNIIRYTLNFSFNDDNSKVSLINKYNTMMFIEKF